MMSDRTLFKINLLLSYGYKKVKQEVWSSPITGEKFLTFTEAFNELDNHVKITMDSLSNGKAESESV